MKVGSKDSCHRSLQKGETPADSVDELEAETSFTNPIGGFMDPMRESPLDSSSATTSADINCNGDSFVSKAWKRNKEAKLENQLKAKKTR